MTTLTRRAFLQGCSAAVAALAGARLTRLGFAAPQSSSQTDTLVFVFLRGGWDALNVAPPVADPDRELYERARPYLRLPQRDLLELDGRFGLHPAMAPLHELYRDGKLALVHACGLDWDTRSHFDAQEYIELGTPGQKNTASGWLARLLQAGADPGALLPALASDGRPTSFHNYPTAVSMAEPSDLSQWDNGLLAEQQQALAQLHSGGSLLDLVGRRTLQAVDLVSPLQDGDYRPANGARYAEDEFGLRLKTVAQLIKLQVGLRAAVIDFGGWDTHEYQNDGSGGYLADLLESLAAGLANFHLDLDSGSSGRVAVVVMSEFGRRLAQNDSQGTDHGHGSLMLALGGGVEGGRVYGTWPGLATDQLYDRADLAITTDYRTVLSELLVRRMGLAGVDTVFPGFEAGTSPLGLFRAG